MIFRSDVLDILDKASSFLVCDMKTGEILYVSRSLEIMFGYMTTNELVGKDVDILVPVDKQKGHKDLRAEYAKNPSIRPMGKGAMLEGRRRDGSNFPVAINIVPAVITGIPCTIAIVVDLTPYKSII